MLIFLAELLDPQIHADFFGWTGMYKDPFTGLYHTHYRDYDPIHNRWLSEDPAGYMDGLNLYVAYMGCCASIEIGHITFFLS